MTGAQERAWRELWPALGIENSEAPLDFTAAFGRDAPVVLEIGFGNGESLVALASGHAERNYLGLEVHPPGVGHLLLCCEAGQLSNVRVICDDAVQVLQRRVPDASFDEVLLYFPDPWPKKRHHKRRIVQPAFVELVTTGNRMPNTCWQRRAAARCCRTSQLRVITSTGRPAVPSHALNGAARDSDTACGTSRSGSGRK